MGQVNLLYRLKKEILALSKNRDIDFLGSFNDISKLEKMYIVFNDNNYFLYDSNDSFMCQAKTIEELPKILLEFKKIRSTLVKYEQDIYLFSDGEVKKLQ